jgi:hypothetical protein
MSYTVISRGPYTWDNGDIRQYPPDQPLTIDLSDIFNDGDRAAWDAWFSWWQQLPVSGSRWDVSDDLTTVDVYTYKLDDPVEEFLYVHHSQHIEGFGPYKYHGPIETCIRVECPPFPPIVAAMLAARKERNDERN